MRSTLKLCVMDEAWRFIQHPTLRAYVEEALKTWRKRNAALVLATQTVEDFASADLLRTVVESCPTKLLLANPAFDRAHYAELFQLNEMELDLLARPHPAAAAPAQAGGPGESAQPECRSEELLDLHEHSHRQRSRRADVPGTRLRGGPRAPRGLGVDR